MSTQTLHANITTPPLHIASLLQTVGASVDTPGNVGVCLSGGGSRAMCAGMGQLRGLQHLGLLGKVKAISSVSGGSWLSTAYTFLTEGTTDEDFLGAFVADPSTLTTASSPAPTSLGYLTPGNLGNTCSSHLFGPAALLLQAIILLMEGVSTDLVWQVLVGKHVLEPYGLYPHVTGGTPTSTFTQNQASWDAITAANPELDVPAAFVAEGSGRTQRAHWIANLSMQVQSATAKSSDEPLIAPVQSTPMLTGLIGRPPAFVSGTRQRVGGGGVTSFAFNSTLEALAGAHATVSQARQWSLMDAAGTSSAFLAAVALGAVEAVRGAPEQWSVLLDDGGQAILDRLASVLPDGGRKRCAALLSKPIETLVDELLEWVADKAGLVPQYSYWPVDPPSGSLPSSEFADGGLLENTGLGGLLGYADIESAIVFVNSSEALSVDDDGVIMVDSQLPVLFGHQPYEKGIGYVPFSRQSGGSDRLDFWYAQAHVLDPAGFEPLLQGLADASANGSGVVVFEQVIETVKNDWFGIKPGRSVKLVWFYLNPASDWVAQLQPDVASGLSSSFPNYSTFSTHLDAFDVNSLAHFTSWCVAGQARRLEALFSGPRLKRG